MLHRREKQDCGHGGSDSVLNFNPSKRDQRPEQPCNQVCSAQVRANSKWQATKPPVQSVQPLVPGFHPRNRHLRGSPTAAVVG
jgi:hypothetical protein